MLLLHRPIDRLDFIYYRRNDPMVRNTGRHGKAEVRRDHHAEVKQSVDQATAEAGLARRGDSLRCDEGPTSRQYGLNGHRRPDGRDVGERSLPDPQYSDDDGQEKPYE